MQATDLWHANDRAHITQRISKGAHAAEFDGFDLFDGCAKPDDDCDA
jgi:hypothetical protein